MDFNAVDLVFPVNTLAPLNRGLAAWWLALPGISGGAKWRDLMSPADLRVGNHGTLTNIAQGPTSGWGGTSRPGGWGEMRFDGSDDYVTTSKIPVTADVPFWGCCWARLSNMSTFRNILSQHAVSNRFALWYSRGARAGDYTFQIYPGSGSFPETSTPLNVLNDLKWHFFVFWYTTSLIGLCVDNRYTSTTNMPVGWSWNPGNQFQISSTSGGVSLWNGAIDDVRIGLGPVPSLTGLYIDACTGYRHTLNRVPTPFAPPQTAGGMLLRRRRLGAFS